jgi:hypothetical protein
MPSIVWLGLGYNVPVNPSKNRVYVWRKLKEFGAGYFKQGVAILPNTAQSMAKFQGLAAKIREMGGDATLVELRFFEPRDEAETIARFQRQSEDEYQELIRDCARLVADMRRGLFPPDQRSEHLKRIMRRFGKVQSRDYFRSRSQESIADGLEELVGDMAHITDEIGRQFRNLLDL